MSDAVRPGSESHARIDEQALLDHAIPIDGDAEEDAAGLEVGAPIELEEEQPRAKPQRVIQTFQGKAASPDARWRRKPNITGQGAVHVRTFVAKLRLDAVEHLDEQINDWLDEHPDYEVKFVTTTIGALVGKLTEEALFVNVWV